MTTTRVSYELNTLREAVQSKFSKLRAALHMREKLLLRQLEVIGQQVEAEPLGVQWLTDDQQETALYENVRSFGRFQLDNMNLTLQQPNSRQEEAIEEQESELLSLTQNKLLMEDTCRQISESIINLTLTEAKKLLNQTQHKIVANFVPALNLEELEEDINSSQVDAISSLLQDQTQSTTQKTPACKHKIVINNCNGTINLRNIASLIINCTGEEAVNTELPLQAAENTITTTTTSSSAHQCQCKLEKNQTNRKQKVQESVKYANHSINSSSLCSHRNKQHQHLKLQQQTQIIEEPTTAATCEFYNNLLQQIKHSLGSNKGDVENDHDNAYYMRPRGSQDAEEHTQLTSVSDVEVDVNENETSGTNSTQSQTQSEQVDGNSTTNNNNNRRLVLRNFENLKIILEANSDEETSHPVQIEQWLAEIISESDLEPITNTDFLEHSKIDSS